MRLEELHAKRRIAEVVTVDENNHMQQKKASNQILICNCQWLINNMHSDTEWCINGVSEVIDQSKLDSAPPLFALY